MKIENIELGETGNYFSPIFLDYIQGKQELSSFYKYPPQISSFEQAIGEKRFSPTQRELLSKLLKDQYKTQSEKIPVRNNIEKLKEENTFTITTGHQLNLFTGPLYFILKIVTVLNSCKALKAQYPDYNFVPVYWMASEDHDFDEINHFNLFGNTYSWKTDQKGPVGRFSTDSLKAVLESIPEKIGLFDKAYRENERLSDAHRYLVHELFGDEGLVIIDADHHLLKGSFSAIIKDDLLNHSANSLVEKSSEALEELQYKNQVFPRKINFFYMEDGIRERIVKEENRYKVLNTSLSFSESDMMSLIDESPEKFSPNVIMRSLYQETILPNLAYIGGPAEVAYWLQLKTVFDHYKTPFPVLVPRNFALVVNKSSVRKLEKLQLDYKSLFLPFHELKQEYIDLHVENGIHLEEEKKDIMALFEAIKLKAAQKDQSLEGFVGAEAKKTLKIVENIAKKLQKSEEKRQETAIKQMESLKEKLFPGGSLQERKENILNFSINNPSIIRFFLDNFQPFDYRFNLILEDE